MPPAIAPGMLPMPPTTAATNALSPGMMPISGSIFGFDSPTSTPAAPASIEPSTKVSEITRLTSMPIKLAASAL